VLGGDAARPSRGIHHSGAVHADVVAEVAKS